MNSQDYRNLQEAYLNVYQELDEKVLGQDPEMRRARTKDDKRLSPSSGKGYADNQKKSISYMNKLTKNNKIIPGMAHEEVEEFDEAVYGGTPKKAEEPKDKRLLVTNADKKGNTPAYQNFKKGDKRYRAADHMDEATAMAKRGLDEPTIRNKIAAKTSASGAGKFADKATKLADRETYGNKEMKAGREKLARAQRGDFRNTTSSSPGLRGYGYKSNDPAVKAKQDARGNQRARAALTPNERKQNNMESYDLFDYMVEYLMIEGYADTNENALVIMANMSEEWRESIIEQQTDPLKTAAENSKKRNDAYGSKKFQQVVDDSPSNPRSKNFNPNSLKTPGV